MDKHYKIKEIDNIWNTKSKYNNWLKIELGILEYYQLIGKLTKKNFNSLKKAFKCYLAKNNKQVKNNQRDLSILIENINKHTNNPAKKWIHYGVSLCDVISCAFAISFKQTNDVIYKDLIKFIELLEKLSLKYKNTLYAEQSGCSQPNTTSIGLKLALYYKEICRNLDRFNLARFQIETIKMACDDNKCVTSDIDLQDFICSKFDLLGNNVSTDYVHNDTFKFYFSVIKMISKTIDKITEELAATTSKFACSIKNTTKSKKCTNCSCNEDGNFINSISIMLYKIRQAQKTFPNLIINKIRKSKNNSIKNKLQFINDQLNRIFNLSAKVDSGKILMYRWEIEYYIEKIAYKLNAKFQDTKDDVYLYMLLTGSITFVGKLITKLNFPCQLKTVQLSFYGKETKASDKKYDLKKIVYGSQNLKDKQVIIVDDLVEEGITINVLQQYLLKFKPKDITTCVLSLKNKPNQRSKPNIYGKTLPNVWLAGYGLDFKGKHRNDDFIWEIKK